MKAVFGTMNIGQQVFGEQAKEMLSFYVGSGGRELDTAYVYNDGACEEEVGACLRELASQELSLATKVNPRVSGRLDHDAVHDQLNGSLRRLGVECVDVLYFHFPDPGTPVESAIQAAAEAHAAGRFVELGVSNFPLDLIERMGPLCDRCGCPRPTVYQGVYNALSRNAEEELFPALDGLGMRFYAFNPLAGGMLTGRYTDFEEVPQEGRFAVRAKSYKGRYWKESFFEATRLIGDACSASGIPVAEASYRWLAQHSMLEVQRGDAVIIGASRLSQLEQNLRSLEGPPLPDSVLEAFERAWGVTRDDAPPYYRYYTG